MSTSHLIDANIHRAKEGARVLEDIARFVIRDEKLFHHAREIRHRMQILAPIDSVKADLGGANFIENNVRTNLITIIQANATRVQEALRVLEEMSERSNEKHLMKTLRYEAYDLHAKLYYSARTYLKLDLLRGLYLIIDTDVIPYPLEKIIKIINESPVNIVQYRNKSSDKKTIFKNVEKIKKHLDSNKLLIINDHIDMALDVGDGIHLGQNDYPLERIRHIIPEHFIFGVSCHSLEEALVATQLGATYIAMGCLFGTKSKHDIVPISISELRKVSDEIHLPVCAIGGITQDNLDQVLSANIEMAALISHVWTMDNPLKAINNMHDKICRFNFRENTKQLWKPESSVHFNCKNP